MPPSLGTHAREAIRDPSRLVYFSAVNVWEIVIKRALGKLGVPRRFSRVLEEQPFERLPTVDHAFKVGELPMHHRDPFDRLLIAQCLVKGLTLVTSDGDIAKYDVPLILTSELLAQASTSQGWICGNFGSELR